MADDSEAKIKITADTSEEEAGMKRVVDSLAELKEAASKTGEFLKSGLEMFGIGVAINDVKDFVSEMGELGEQTERASAMLGVSVEKVGELGFVANMSGMDLQSMSMGMERLGYNMERAEAGSAAEIDTFKRMGISLKDASGNTKSFDEILLEAADSFSKHADGAAKDALAIQAFGRAGVQMIPSLDEGRQHVEDLMEMAKKTGSVFSDELIKKMDDTEHQLVELGAYFTGLKGKLFDEFKPAIDSVLDTVKNLIIGFEAWGTQSTNLGSNFRMLALGVDVVVAAINMLVSGIEMLWDIGGSIVTSLSASFVAFGREMQDVWNRNWSDIPKAAADAKAEIVKTWGDTLGDMTKLSDDFVTNTQKLFADTMRPPQEPVVLGNLDGLPDFASPANEAKTKAAMDTIKKELNDINSMFNSLFSSIIKGLDTAISGLISGTMTWQQALGSAFNSIYQAFVDMAEQMLSKWLAGQATMLVAKLTGNEAMAASDTATQTQGAITMLLSALKSIGTSSAVTAAGVTANLAPTLGPLAIPAGDAAGAEVMAFATGLSAFDVGSWNIDRDQIAQVHQGEMIVPAYNGMADMMRNMMGGGGGGFGGNTEDLVNGIVNGLAPHMRGQQFATQGTQRVLNEMLRRSRR